LFRKTTEKQITESEVTAEEIYAKYRGLVYHVTTKVLHDSYLVEDAVSETFIRVIKNIHKLNTINESERRSYIAVIARNEAITIYNKVKKHDEIATAEEWLEGIVDESATVEGTIVNNESYEEVVKLVYELPETLKEVLILHYFQEFSLKEISEILSVDYEAIKKRFQRAKQSVRRSLEQAEKEKRGSYV